MTSRFLLLLSAAVLCGTARALPPDFEISQFAGGLRDPATMAFAPDGRLFVGERITGNLRIFTASGQLLATPFLTLDVPAVRHRSGGLRGFAFDPGFPAEPYVYIFYTKKFAGNVRHNRISRFTVSAGDPNRADAGSELVLLELPFNNQALGSSGSHNGGAVVFGGDEKLYFTTGDGWNASNGYGAGDSVQSLSTYTGKVFRLNKDGSIPADNPFYNQAAGNYRAIYALGLRNPYAATVHPVSGEVFVFDVGTANGGNKDYIYKVSAGDNYGHDGYGGIGNQAGTWANAGTAIISGGVWYFGDQFPAEYQERMFVTSWKKGLKTVASLSDTTVADFGSAEVGDQGPLYPCVSPDGSLYYLESTYETSNGRIFKVSYTNLNRAADVVVSPNGGAFVDSVSVTLTCETAGAVIRYTTDGSEPGPASPVYAGAVVLTNPVTLKARAYADGYDPGSVATTVFDVQAASAPQFLNAFPAAAALGVPFEFTAQASGVPAPVFSLDEGPQGMTVNAETGGIFWIPSEPGNVTVTLRAGNGYAPDAVRQATISVGNFLAPENPDPLLLTQGGLHYSYFEEGQQAVSAGVVTVPGAEVRLRDDNFRIRFEGFVEIPSAGEYELIPVTADSARVWTGGIDVTGQTIHYGAGLHSFVLEYEETTGGLDLELRWSGPGLVEQPVPASAFHRFTGRYGIFQVEGVPAGLGTFPVDETGAIPQTLSETGAFIDLAKMNVRAGLVRYTPNSKLWSDGAVKHRWIAVPAGDKIGFRETGAWAFPAGTVLVKHFEIGEEKRRIETRFEVVKDGGSSYLVTYRWREDQSEADLVPVDGDEADIHYDGKSQRWFFPSREQCVACHNSSINHVLGVSTRQLNGLVQYDSGVADNQLRTWSHLDLLDSPPAESGLAALNALSGVSDSGASVEHRVRSYFDSNCAYCHNQVAAPEGTNFVLDFDTPLAASNLIDAVTTRPLGLGLAARIVAPRDPKNSVLFHRMMSNDPAVRMPPVGRTIVHREAREALAEWILSLPPASTSVDVPDYSRRWTFDGTTGDGVWRDTVEPPVYAAGQNGQALSFDGENDAVDLGPLDVSGSEALTITFWFRADDFGTSDARFLSKADGQYDDDHYWMVSTLNGSQLRFRLRAGGSTSNLVSASGTLSTGVWTHVAARYDGATMSLFKNGVEVASQAKSGVLDTSGTVDAAIGNQPTTATGGSRPFDGLIDDMRIYPRALSTAEIATVRDAGSVLNSAPTVQFGAGIETTGSGNFITRAAAATISATAGDAEDGDLSSGVTWFSTETGDVRPENLGDGPHSLIATARDSSGSADSVLLRLHVVPGFEGWAEDFSLPANPLLDHDGNGLTLLEEYARPGAKPGPVFVESADELVLGFTANPLAIDVRYLAEFGTQLDDFAVLHEWLPLGDSISGGPGNSVREVDGVFEIHADFPTHGAERGFGRIVIEKN